MKRLSADPDGHPEAGIGRGGDNPAFRGMHEAGAMVAGGSIRAMEAILRGDEEHAFHPGGGLHHAMADRASGFCIYDDPALAIARARRDGPPRPLPRLRRPPRRRRPGPVLGRPAA